MGCLWTTPGGLEAWRWWVGLPTNHRLGKRAGPACPLFGPRRRAPHSKPKQAAKSCARRECVRKTVPPLPRTPLLATGTLRVQVGPARRGPVTRPSSPPSSSGRSAPPRAGGTCAKRAATHSACPPRTCGRSAPPRAGKTCTKRAATASKHLLPATRKQTQTLQEPHHPLTTRPPLWAARAMVTLHSHASHHVRPPRHLPKSQLSHSHDQHHQQEHQRLHCQDLQRDQSCPDCSTHRHSQHHPGIPDLNLARPQHFAHHNHLRFQSLLSHDEAQLDPHLLASRTRATCPRGCTQSQGHAPAHHHV